MPSAVTVNPLVMACPAPELSEGIVEVRDRSSADVPDHVRVVGLPFAGVIVLANDASSERIKQAVTRRAIAKPEVARVLVQKRGQDSVAEHGAVEGIQVGRAGSLAVSLGAPAESRIVRRSLSR